MNSDDPFTTAIQADRDLRTDADVAPPIRPSTTFEEGADRRYRRASHATTERLEAVLGALDGGFAVAYSSGMAAATAALDHLRPQRIAIGRVYHGIGELVRHEVERDRIAVVPPDELGPGDLWWIETPSNPHCRVTDLAAAVARARVSGAITVVDATLATPIGLRPLEHGCDLVMHSTTKAIGGHSDTMGGVLVARSSETAERLRDRRAIMGAIPGSLDVWLALRGVRTLPLRYERATRSAEHVAAWAEQEGLVVHYPGLASNPTHAIAVEQMHGFGALLSIDVGDHDRAALVAASTQVFTSATSLGGVESLIEHRIKSDPEIEPGLLRLSIGLEDPGVLIADLTQALRSNAPT